MSARLSVTQLQRWRSLALWLCLSLFVVRVVGQIEVLVLSPHWLPPFRAWESGLIPYSVLLPIQIILIAWMAIIATDHWRGSGYFWVTHRSTRRRLMIIAEIYFAVMLLRVAIAAYIPPHSLAERGLIPVIAHWDLAAFIYLTACTPGSTKEIGITRTPSPSSNG
jgi:hypothetical protein